MEAILTLAAYKWTSDIPDLTIATGAIKIASKEIKPKLKGPRGTEKNTDIFTYYMIT